MKTKEERQARRQAAIKALGDSFRRVASHAVRPMDADDKEAAQALATALFLASHNGITADEWDAIEVLFEELKEARANTP